MNMVRRMHYVSVIFLFFKADNLLLGDNLKKSNTVIVLYAHDTYYALGFLPVFIKVISESILLQLIEKSHKFLVESVILI